MKSTKKQIILVFAILTMAIILSCAFVACDKVEPDKTGTDTVSEYKVIIHPNNGQDDIVWDTTKAIPTITKDGFHIAGYFLDAQLTISTTLESLKATDITKNIDVYVKWAEDVCEHVEVADNAVEPTCTEKGLTEGTHCSKCGKILQEQNEIPALGHDLEHHDEKTATCTEKGWKEYDTCKREGCDHTTYEEIPALGHAGGTATCTEQATCSVCGEKYGDALGHNYGDIIPKTEPTCSEKGVEAHYKCSVCNKVFKNDEHKTETTLDELTIAINPNAHNFGNWIKNEGADTHTGVCSYNSEHTETESCHGGTATCIEQAVCEKCNAKYGELAKHDYKDGVCIVCGIRRLSEGLEYSLNSDGNGYTVTGIGTCTDKELIIPSEYDAKPVTSIGVRAFYNCTGLTSITIGGSVTSIREEAFDGCDKIQNIYITDIVAWCNIAGLSNLMGYGTSNKKLYINNELATSITIPNGIKAIPSSAFSSCTELTNVTIGNSVTSIGERAFYGCNNLQDIYITDIAAWCNISGLNYLMSYGASDKKLYINNELATSITIPNEVMAIPSYAFYNCTGLTSINIPDSVTSIGFWAFRGCTGLTSVTIPDRVTSIVSGTFYNCTGLTSVTIVGSVTSIGDSAFSYCTRLTSITIPDSVKSIGSWAFRGCTGLTSVTIPDRVTSIGSGTFSDCTKLTNVTIGDSVTSIGSTAFYNCSGLTSITIPDSVTSIGEVAFFGCTGLTSITIPDSVTSIGSRAFDNTLWYNNEPDGLVYAGKVAYEYKKGTIPSDNSIELKEGTLGIADYAFFGCTDLTSVTIGNSVTSIGEGAFFGCTGLTSINFNGTIEQWNAISKGYNWKDNVPATQVICTDGTVSI